MQLRAVDAALAAATVYMVVAVMLATATLDVYIRSIYGFGITLAHIQIANHNRFDARFRIGRMRGPGWSMSLGKLGTADCSEFYALVVYIHAF